MEWARIERERERGSGESVCVWQRRSLPSSTAYSAYHAQSGGGGAARAALRISTIQVSRPDHTKHVAAHVLWCQEKTHPVGRFPTSHRADPPQRRWMYNAVIFDLVKYVPHCCRRAAAAASYVMSDVVGLYVADWMLCQCAFEWVKRDWRHWTVGPAGAIYLSNLTWSTDCHSQRPLHITA